MALPRYLARAHVPQMPEYSLDSPHHADMAVDLRATLADRNPGTACLTFLTRWTDIASPRTAVAAAGTASASPTGVPRAAMAVTMPTNPRPIVAMNSTTGNASR